MSNNTLTKNGIVNAIYKQTDHGRSEVQHLVDYLLALMKQAMKKDKALLVSGLGKFEVCDKKARRGRNPQTTESIVLPPRKVVTFRLSRKFRAELNPGE